MIRFAWRLILLSAIGCWSSWAGGEEQSSPRVKLEDLVREALENNPNTVAAERRWTAAKERVPQAEALDDPMFGFTHFVDEVETRVGPQENIVNLGQKFPFYRKRDLRGDIARREADIAEQDYEIVKREVIADLKKTFYELWWNYQATEINQAEQDVLGRLERVAQIKYGTGQATQQDVLKAQVEISRLEDRLLVLEQQRESLVAMLNNLLNRPPSTQVGGPEDPLVESFDYDLKTLRGLAGEHRQEIKAADYGIERWEAAVKLAKKNYFPDITLNASWIDIGHRPGGDRFPLRGNPTLSLPSGMAAYGIIPNPVPAPPRTGDDAFTIGFSINVPIWLGKLRAGVREASARKQASEFLKMNVINRTMFEVEDFYQKVDTAWKIVSLYDERLIPESRQSLQAAEAGYETGGVDFLDLLDSERTYLVIRLGRDRALTDFHRGISDLERAVGIPLNGEMPPSAEPKRMESNDVE